MRDPAAKTIFCISVILPRLSARHSAQVAQEQEPEQAQEQAPCAKTYKLLLVSALLSRFVCLLPAGAGDAALQRAGHLPQCREIKFVHSQLRPAIDRERLALAAHHGKHWHRFFNLSLTLCDGTPARLSAMIEGLRRCATSPRRRCATSRA